MKIKLPKGLIYQIENDRSLKRALSIYVYIKAIDPEGRGLAKMDLKAKQEAALWLGTKSTRTIDAWLNDAIKHKLIIKNERTLYAPISWDRLCSTYNVSGNGYYHIPLGNIEIEQIFWVKYEIEYRRHCKVMAESKKFSPLHLIDRSKVMQSKGLQPLNDSDLKQLQYEDYLSGYDILDETERFAVEYYNPDLYISLRKYNEKSGTKNYFFRKQKLISLGMIEAIGRSFTIERGSDTYKAISHDGKPLFGFLEHVKGGHVKVYLADRIIYNPYNRWTPPKK